MSVRAKILIGIALMLMLILAGTGFTVVSVRQQRAGLNDVDAAAETVTTRSLALMRAAKDIEFDVVQVQQFLSDISATRAQDGLDDGFKKAQRFADKFASDADAATATAQSLHQVQIVERLGEVRKAFLPYYETGRRMAQRYIDSGSTGGNQLMPQFDKASDTMQEQVEQLLSVADAAVRDTTDRLGQTVGRIKQEGDRVVSVALLLGVISTLVAGAMYAASYIGVIRPLGSMTAATRRLADGDLTVHIPGGSRSDEIGAMARAVRVFRDHMTAEKGLAAEKVTEHERAETTKHAALVGMADKIEADTAAALREVATHTAAMITTAGEMSASAVRTDQSAQSAAVASAQALTNAETVASAAEQLNASIREIAAQVAQSTEVVRRAVAAGSETRATIEELNDKAARIGAVADMIAEIAAKTNLLALNATIEAARAGDAGKGFAVVASEVKALATQTARSTHEIAQHIAQVRDATGASVAAVDRIERTIGEIDAIAGSVAAAVEQQGAATAEIARSVAETASAAHEMTDRTKEVSTEAEQTGKRSVEVRESAAALDAAVEALRHSVIRVVRTSTSEVNRRQSLRHEVDLPCHLTSPGQAKSAARVVDISADGARIHDGPSLSPGTRGTLQLVAVNAPIPFVVRAREAGVLHLMFELDSTVAASLKPVLDGLASRHAA
ncbi:MAG: methyl-accepting chemotaxis protein [Acetobacteraceae bacterium]|jgi:methyl-accepting chemotaxis protein